MTARVSREDPAHGGHPLARHRLAVGDDGEGLEGGLGQAGLLPVEDESLDHGRVLVAAVHPPPSPDLAQ